MFLLKKACAEPTLRIPPGRLPGPCRAGSVPPTPLTPGRPWPLGDCQCALPALFFTFWKGEQKVLCDWDAVAEGGFGWGLGAG